MPKCKSCGAALNARANRCAVCDAPIAVAAPIGVQVSQGGLAALPADELPIAAELGKALAPSIHLRKRIGRGGMGIVFLGRDESLKRDVAIKVLAPDLANDPITRARFVREAEAAAAVSHPNVVNIYHVGVLPQTEVPYFVMQYVEGPSMAEASGRMMPEVRVRRVIGEVASGLAAAHRRGVVHRDIKPGNIVVDGETGRALLCDFGIAAAGAQHMARRSDRLTSEGSYVGTPAYMSPEIASGEEAIDKSDVYSLGVVAYELLTGHVPFAGTGIKVLAAHVHDEVPDLHALRADLSPEIVELVERSLAKNPKDRPSAQSIVDHLLPGNRHALEWPPPGLAPLRRASAQFRFGLVSLALTCAAFLFAMYARPVPQLSQTTGVRATEAFDLSRTVRSVMPQVIATDDQLQELEVVWSAAAYTAFLLLLLATSFVAVQIVPTVRAMRMARRSGYPWSTVADVMSDMRRDTGDLLSGLGSYAFFNDLERNLIVRTRRIRLIGIAGAAIVAVGSLLVWAAGGVAAIAGEASGTSMAPLWLTFVPLVVLGVCASLALSEALLRRRRAQADEDWQGAHLVNEELVNSWVVSAGRRFSGSTGLSRLPLEIVFGAVLLVIVSAALIIANAALGVAIRASAHRSVALSWLTTVSDTNYAIAWRGREQTLARATAVITNGAQPLDARSQARFLASFVAPASGVNSLLARDAVDSTLYIGSSLRVARGDVLDALSRRPLAPQQPNFFARPAPVSGEVLATWRAVAHAQVFPRFWPYRGGSSPEPIDIDPGALQTLAAANLYDALHGGGDLDLGRVELRARENLAVARQLTRAGAAPFMTVGGITGDAADALDFIGRAREDQGLITEAANIRAAGVYRPTSSSAGALFADPTYLPVTKIPADTLLEPATRVQLAQLAAAGFCENPREVLFGPATSRTTLAAQAGAGLSDLAGADRLVDPWEHWLAESIVTKRTPLTADPGGTHAPASPGRAVMFATGLFRLHGLRSRLAFCSPP